MEGGQKLYALYHLSTGLLGGQGDAGGWGPQTMSDGTQADRQKETFEKEKLILGA